MWISDVSIKRPVFAVMLIGALVTLGWISLGRLGVDLFPKVEFPIVSVTTLLEGASPETIESEVSDPIEEEVNTASGIETLSSTSSEGRSSVIIEFGLDEDVDVKAQDVRDKVASAREDLPSDAEQSIVQKTDPDAQPIMSVMIAGDMPIRDLTRFADKTVKEHLQRVSGVGSISLVGGRDREIRIWLDALKLRAYGVTADDVISALRREHAEIPGGRLETAGLRSEFSVKTMGEVTSVEEFGDIVIAFQDDGLPTRIRDVARVEDGMEDLRSYAELDGKPGISLEIRRQSGRNTVEVARAIREELASVRALAPPGVRIVSARDTSLFIEAAANDVFDDIMLGVVLVVLVTLAFLLSFRATLIVAVAMPTALISCFFAFYVMDFSINLMTLMALSIAVGLLVDDAIVVLESIYRKLDEGYPPMEAASLGVKQVGLAVLAGTASICAVFVPIAFMEGVVGRFFFQYGLAITFSVLVSLLTSLTLTPMLCSRLLDRSNTDPEQMGRIAKAFDHAYERLEGFYRKALELSLRFRWAVILGAVITIVVGVMVARTLPVAFDTKSDRSEFLANIDLPFGAGIEQTRQIASRVAARLQQLDHVETVFYTIGAGAQQRVNEAAFYIGLTPKADRDVPIVPIMVNVRNEIKRAAPEAENLSVTEVPWIGGSGFSSFELMYAIRGADLAVLQQRTEAMMARMRESGHFADVQSTFETGKPEVQVDIDRNRAADLGVSMRTLAESVRALVGGVDVTTYEEYGSRYDVRVRLEETQRNDVTKLEMIQIRATNGQLIDIANLASFDIESGPAQIERQNRSRRIAIVANTPEGVALGDAAVEMEQIIREVGLPAGYFWSAEGKAKRMKENQQAISFAFLLALTALYMILASQFNSFAQPVIIMLTAPLSFVGAFIALSYSGLELTMFAQIGLLALMGLVMKNGILLVDYANKMKEQLGSSRQAMIEAGPVRLRPVLMTAFSTICGMIPVALSTSQGAEFRNAMGYLVIGGLASSTFLTLLVVPVAYTLMDDAQNLIKRGLARVLPDSGPGGGDGGGKSPGQTPAE
ncbi:MAG: efflux RND transporter permease subunit [Parvibaculaceae bacterium]